MMDYLDPTSWLRAGFTPSSMLNLVAPRQMYAEWMQSQTQCPCRPLGGQAVTAWWQPATLPMGCTSWGVGGTEVGFDPSAKPRDLVSSIVRSGGKMGRPQPLGIILGSLWEHLKCGKSLDVLDVLVEVLEITWINPNIISKHCKKTFMLVTNMFFSTMASNQIPCSS